MQFINDMNTYLLLIGINKLMIMGFYKFGVCRVWRSFSSIVSGVLGHEPP